MMNEARALALGEVLKQVALVPGPAKETAIFCSVMDALGVPEEECGWEITMAVFLLVRSGLLLSSTPGSSGCDTVLTPSQPLIDFMWTEHQGADEFEDDEQEGGVS